MTENMTTMLDNERALLETEVAIIRSEDEAISGPFARPIRLGLEAYKRMEFVAFVAVGSVKNIISSLRDDEHPEKPSIA